MLDDLMGWIVAFLPWRVQLWLTGILVVGLIVLFAYLWSDNRLSW